MFDGERSPGEHWTTRDRELAIALEQLDGSLCSGCGQPQWLAFDPSLSWDVDDKPYRCFPCTYLETSAAEFMGGERPPEHPSALRWTVRQYHHGDE